MVLSSPSGGGKTSIARRLLAERADLAYSVSATTRTRRPGEVDGNDYHFLSRPEFERRAAVGDFLEWAEYGANLYGTLRSAVDNGIETGRHVVLDIEVKGADQLRATYPNAIHVFVLPPSVAELVRRLENRGTEDPGVVQRRLKIAAEELAVVGKYDYVVVNDDLAAAVRRVGEIIDAEAARPRRLKNLTTMVNVIRGALVAELHQQ